MRIIPVLDLQAGQAVHAVAGDRTHYRPLRSIFAATSDPLDLARGLRDQFGASELYLADLDAIVTRTAPAFRLFRAIADLGLMVWADIGIRDDADLDGLLGAGVTKVIGGLETLLGPPALERVVARIGADRAVFSLDLRAGKPLVPASHCWAGDPTDPENLVKQAVEAGVQSIIRLDLAEVGTSRGVANVPPVPATRHRVAWITGGGVTSVADVAILARQGYSAVLVGSALHDGRIKAGGTGWANPS